MSKQNKNLLSWLIPKCTAVSDVPLQLNEQNVSNSIENQSNNTTSQIENLNSEDNLKSVSDSKICNKDLECSQNSSTILTSLPNKKESTATTDNATNISKKTNYFKHYHRNGKHFVRCEACYKFPNLVRTFSEKSQIPNISQECGAIYRKEYVDKHLETKYHQQCEKALRLSTLSVLDAGKSSPMGHSILKSQANLANKIGALFNHVYGDAKKLTLSAHTYPMRVVTSMIANNFSFESYTKNDGATANFDFQYMMPSSHKELLQCIVESFQDQFAAYIKSYALAMSLRCDGSVDRSQIDKIYILLKIITKKGEQEQYFLGAGQVCQRGADGVLDAIESACRKSVGQSTMKYILTNISSIVTDGANINIGTKGGLWTLIENKWRKVTSKSSPSSNVPLQKIWCVAHRSNLAWKDTSNSVPEIKHLFEKLIGLSTFFHTSALRSRELEDIASTNNYKLLRLPKLFTVRWTEFSFSLVNAVLTSWRALVKYMQTSKEKETKGFLNFLLDEDNIKFLAFMADLLSVFSRYQKKLQSDSITILDMTKETILVIERLKTLNKTNLMGGWVQALNEASKNDDKTGTISEILGIKLQDPRIKRRKEHHKYVSDTRILDSVFNEIIISLTNFLYERIDINSDFIKYSIPFVSLEPTADIKKVHEILASDIDLMELSFEYEELLKIDSINDIRKMNLPSLLSFLVQSEFYQNLSVTLSRVLVAKPHSADVERLISTANVLKSYDRQHLSVETENEYLFIHYNMPSLTMWDPRPAVQLWINKVDRRVKDTHKAKEQIWFKGIFDEADKKISVDEQNEEQNQPKKIKKF